MDDYTRDIVHLFTDVPRYQPNEKFSTDDETAINGFVSNKTGLEKKYEAMDKLREEILQNPHRPDITDKLQLYIKLMKPKI